MPTGRLDYDNVPRTVTFQPDSNTNEMKVNISIIDDGINEGEEGFVLVLQQEEAEESDNVDLTTRNVTLIRITDNDCKCGQW